MRMTSDEFTHTASGLRPRLAVRDSVPGHHVFHEDSATRAIADGSDSARLSLFVPKRCSEIRDTAPRSASLTTLSAAEEI
jgi:hypothetical protein